MLLPLIKYNISYYAKTSKFIAPSLVFIIFLFFIYNQIPISIWSNFYITAMAIFVLTNWIGTSFLSSEDKTQGYITRLHAKNEKIYHISKIASILVIMTPFYAILIFYPIVFGFFARGILASELLVAVAMHFSFSLMGCATSLFFDKNLSKKEAALPLQLVIILICVIPLALIFEGNALVRYATYLLPPLNFLGQRLHDLDSGIFEINLSFLLFILYSLGYSLVLIVAYIFLVQKKNKR